MTALSITTYIVKCDFLYMFAPICIGSMRRVNISARFWSVPARPIETRHFLYMKAASCIENLKTADIRRASGLSHKSFPQPEPLGAGGKARLTQAGFAG